MRCLFLRAGNRSAMDFGKNQVGGNTTTTTNGDLLLSHFELCKYDKPISEPSLGVCEILILNVLLLPTMIRFDILRGKDLQCNSSNVSLIL